MATSSRSPKTSGNVHAGRPGRSENKSDPAGGLIGRTMPHNVEAEQGLLASCILDSSEVLPLCMERALPPEAFYVSTHQIIYDALVALYEKKTAADEILLAEELSNRSQLDVVGGIPGINQITDRIETTAHASYFLDIVRTKYLLRRLIRCSTRTVERCFEEQENLEEFLQNVESEIFEIGMDKSQDASRQISQTIDAAVTMVHSFLEGKGAMRGIATGFKDLDGLTLGLQKNNMIVLAARPSMGKTSLALNIAETAALPKEGEGSATIIFSLEMGHQDLGMRLLCARSRVSMSRLQDGFCSPEEKQMLASAAIELKKAPIVIDDSSNLTIMELRAKARRIASRIQHQFGSKVGLIVIDYLQLLAGTNSAIAREQQISEISRGIKGLAKELDVPVVVLSQLNRDMEKEKRKPRLSDLRESGSIEQDADVVLLLSKPKDSEDEYQTIQNVADLIVAKQRNGPVGELKLTFRKEYTRFENHSPQPHHESAY
ncbi:MAG: replicative DNA helicase [Opitutaceae bacterium]|nr:replicative DNA helicase [Opitutaceae bacterium]|tara:strand:- start:10396 stop:11862 length:1467 start_codon:yes stop_codon:yes gene_type:complete